MPASARASPPASAAVVLAFASVYIAWGTTYLAIRVGVASLPPTVLGATRYVVAGGGMLLALRAAGRRIAVDARELRDLLVIATLLLVGGNGLVIWAEQSVPSGLAALIVATMPLWMAGMAALPPLRERLPARAIAGLGLGFVGVAVLVAPGLHGPAGAPLGELALLVASFSWACGSLYARRARLRIDPIAATGWQMLLGGLLFLALAVILGSFAAARPTASGIAAVVYLITCGSWIGFTAYVWLLAHVPAAKVVTYAYVNPVIAVVLGWWVLGEPITASVVAGSAIIVVAVVMVTGARLHAAPAALAAGTIVEEMP